MSKKPTRTSQQIQSEYNDTCFKLGQEVAAERRSKANQSALAKHQQSLEEEFSSAVQREQEFAKQNKKAEEATKEFESKAKGVEVAPPSQESNSGKVIAAITELEEQSAS